MVVKKKSVKGILAEASMLGVCVIFSSRFIIFSSIHLNRPGKRLCHRYLSP